MRSACTSSSVSSGLTVPASDGPHVGLDSRLMFQWSPAEQTSLAGLPLFPVFLRRALAELPKAMRHVIEYD